MFYFTEIQECRSGPCLNGDCLERLGGYQCDCEDGYMGPICDQGKTEACGVKIKS